jgi:hypothetical protein
VWYRYITASLAFQDPSARVRDDRHRSTHRETKETRKRYVRQERDHAKNQLRDRTALTYRCKPIGFDQNQTECTSASFEETL